MPRILDSLDAAVGGTPETLDDAVDYLTQQRGPERLIGADQRYNAGWFTDFTGELNFDDTHALRLAFQTWMHLSIDAPAHFIVLNLADLAKAGQTALLVAEKSTGRFFHGTSTRMFPRNTLHAAQQYRHLDDPHTHSFVHTDEQHERWSFSVHAQGLHLSGTARRIGGPAFTQVTRYQRMRGSLQRYGNLVIENALLTVEGNVISIPPGTLGTFDHTLGHQRGLQNWNWLATVGHAIQESTGKHVLMGLQVVQDRPLARPRIQAHKHLVWVHDQLYKVPTASFYYDIVDEQARETSAWTVTSTETNASRWFNLRFTPQFHRREQKSVVLVDADFNQYYGQVSGQVGIDGETYTIADLFAVCEDSRLEI